MKKLAQRFVNGLLSPAGLRIQSKSDKQKGESVYLRDAQFKSTYENFSEYTMVPLSGCHTAYMAAKYVAKNDIQGAIVECGVYRGGCTLMMADALLAEKDDSRDIYLYDTFSGMSEPTEADQKQAKRGLVRAIDEYENKQADGHSEWSYSPIEEVMDNLQKSKYPFEKFKTVKGKVEDTIPEQSPSQISVLRLDTDWYESTKHELDHLFGLLTIGGVLIIDDYGSWAGSTKATDEFFDRLGFRPFFFTDPTNGAVSCVKLPASK